MTKTYTATEKNEELRNAKNKVRRSLFQNLKEGWKTAMDYQSMHPEQFPNQNFSALIFC